MNFSAEIVTPEEAVEKPVILYVDDEESNLASFKAAFRRTYTILTAISPREAIKILRENNVDIIITDQRMPDMTGVQFLEAIITEHPDPIRFILTGFSDIEAIIRAINKGRIFRYVTKPWEIVELKQAIDSGLKLHKLLQNKRKLFDEMEKQRVKQEQILSVFKKYNPSQTSDELLLGANASYKDQLFRGEYRIITVLFAHISWNFNYKDEPKEVIKDIALLNKCLTTLSNSVSQHKGIVDKFIGSNMLALFGVPVSYIENQDNALFCAVEMQEQFKKFKASCPPEIATHLELNIALHTGNAVVGNIGSEQYMSYTAIGDTVNVTARVLEYAKSSKKDIVITQTLKDVADEHSQIEDLGNVQLRGRSGVVHLYSVIKLLN